MLLNVENDGRSHTRSSGSSTPMRSPFDLRPFQDGNAGVAEFIKSVPEPLLEAFSKLSSDFATKVAATDLFRMVQRKTSKPEKENMLEILSAKGKSKWNLKTLPQLAQSLLRLSETSIPEQLIPCFTMVCCLVCLHGT